MHWQDTFGRMRRYRRLVWIPRGPAGIILFFVVLLLLFFLIAAVSAIFLAAAVAVGLAFAVYRAGSRLASGTRDQVDGRLAGARARRLHDGRKPLERYLDDVDEFDRLTVQTLRLKLETTNSWRSRRRVVVLEARATALRESAIAVERDVSLDHAIDAARPGLWELIVAATELQRFLRDLLAFPSTRGPTSQLRELRGLDEQLHEVERRRDELVRHLQQTDLRSRPDPLGGPATGR